MTDSSALERGTWLIEQVHTPCAACDRAATTAIEHARRAGTLVAHADAGEGNHAAQVTWHGTSMTRLCKTCGSFWPRNDDGLACCGAPELDLERASYVTYDHGVKVMQWDGAIIPDGAWNVITAQRAAARRADQEGC